MAAACSRHQGAKSPVVKVIDIDLAALEAAMPPLESDGVTMAEICSSLGHDRRWVGKRLDVLKQQGRLSVGCRTEIRIDNQRIRKPTYKIV
jgi:hypothetical protein